MFGFLKRKIGDVVNRFSKEVEEESVVVDDVEEPVTESKQSQEQHDDLERVEKVKDIEKPVDTSAKQSSKKLADKKISVDKKLDLVPEDKEKENLKKEEVEENIAKKTSQEDVLSEEPKKRGFFSKISDTFTKFKLSEEKFEEMFWDLEVALLENNVAMEVIQKIKDDLKEELTKEKISRKKASDIILDSLHNSLKEILTVKKLDLLKEVNSKKPFVIAVIGVNGSGKTTSIAKLCHYLKNHNKSVVLAAADTFRAAAIQQIEHHANALDIKLIKHDYNSDPSAVAFDAIRHAESKDLDVVVIDTAGRLHSNDNLMNELKKLVRVNKPDLKLFVGESITGNDCVEQAKKYDEIIGIDAIILSKADIDEKGGAALSISYVTKKPVIFIGTGQNYEDLEEFDEKKILGNLGI